jgi:hypothetical protein
MVAPIPPTLALVSDSGVDGDLITNTAKISATIVSGNTPTFAIETDSSTPTTTPPADLPPGTYEIRVTAVDAAGNGSSKTIVEVTVLPLPSVTLNDPGLSATDTITKIGVLDVLVGTGLTAEFSYDNRVN